MQLTVTVADPLTQANVDLLVDVDEATTVAELTRELVDLLRGAPAARTDAGTTDGSAAGTEGVTSLDSRRQRNGTPGAGAAVRAGVRLFVGGEPLDPSQPLSLSPVRDGALITLDAPELSNLAEPAGTLDIRVVGGPGSGMVHRLTLGEALVGSAPECAVRLDLAGIPPHAFTAAVHVDGTCTVVPAPGVDLWLEQAAIEEETPWPEQAYLRVGRSLLELRRSCVPDAALQPSDDGVSMDYNRPPRLLPPIRQTRFELPREPVAPRTRSLPLLAILAPLVMAGVLVWALGSWRYALFALMSPVMAIGSYVSGRTGNKKQYRKDLETYRERKEQVEQDAQDALLAERAIRRAQAPDPAELLLIAAGPRARLWERRRDDPDYLVLRAGTADLPSEVRLEDPDQASHRREVTWEALDAPVTVSLSERGVVGVAGRPDLTHPLAAWMVAQAAVLHSPRDVQIFLLTDGTSRASWEWLRWLPHCRPQARRDAIVLVGTDTESVARRLGELQAIVGERWAARRSSVAPVVLDEPDIVVVLDGARRLRLLPGVVQVLKEGPAVGVYALCIDSDERLLPEECTAVLRQSGPTTVTVRQQRTDVVSDARADLVPPPWFQRVARALAPVKDVTDDGGETAMPDGCRLLDVIGLEPPTAGAVSGVWMRGGRTTEAVVGMSMDGPFALDLRRDGPHALIAGTTGAGKSELLQTLVASLAVVNRPDAMTFVLVDYKGGSAFKDCVDLPHTVGMVTDLDTHLVERALESLAAELHRREHMLAGAGAKDIEDYTDLAAKAIGVSRIGGVGSLPPLPRLLIVIDEFASMARELPDFVSGLVNIAQRGRSLGIHLILATQRPSGVVSPEIRANTNLRIALRVTDRTESADVIDAGDAALINKSTPGRAYVRLGASSLVPFQAGRVGGRRPGSTSASRLEPWLTPLDWPRLGHPPTPRPRAEQPETDAAATDLGMLVGAIRAANDAMSIPPQHSPWLPALTNRVTLDELPPYEGEERELAPVAFAVADLPSQQARRAEVIDLSTLGHKFVIGSARSGRTQTLRTIAGAIARAHSSADVHMYGVDCGSGGLLPLAELPHCGAVVQRTQTDRAQRLLSRLVDEVARRQEVLAAGGFASVSEQRATVPPGERLPHVLVFLDRWEGFVASLAELDGGRLQTAMMTLLNEGASAGMHCVISGDRSLTSYRLASTTEDKLVLRLSDRGDYSAAGISPRTLPEVIPDGRAFQPDGAIETQVAVLDGPVTGQGQAAALAAIGRDAAQRDAGLARSLRPFRIDVLPATLSFEDAWGYVDDGPRRPLLWSLLGVGGDDLEAHGPDLAVTPTFVVAGPAKSGRSTVLTTMARSLLDRGVALVLVAPRQSPLRELDGRDGVRALITSDRLAEEDLAPLEVDGPVVLVIDDAEMHKDTPAGDLLKAFIRTAADRRRALVIAGTVTDLSAGYSGWHAEARKGRAGALLSPQGLSDGELIGTRVPRSLVGEPVKPGRALVHLGAGTLVTVAVPRAD